MSNEKWSLLFREILKKSLMCASDYRTNTLLHAAEVYNESMMHSLNYAVHPHMKHVVTSRRKSSEKRTTKSFSIWTVFGPFMSLR